MKILLGCLAITKEKKLKDGKETKKIALLVKKNNKS
jgi:predicted GIY-YIG superfamily endonuclease